MVLLLILVLRSGSILSMFQALLFKQQQQQQQIFLKDMKGHTYIIFVIFYVTY